MKNPYQLAENILKTTLENNEKQRTLHKTCKLSDCFGRVED